MKKFFIMCILFICTCLYAEDVTNLLEPPERYQGVWKIIASSTDKGVTQTDGEYTVICKVTATKVLNFNGTSYTIKNVGQIEENGIIYTMMSFVEFSDKIWVISDKGNSTILLQTLSSAQQTETFRALFLVVK